MLELTITSAPAVKPRYCCNGFDCLTDITTDQSVKRHALNLLQCHSVLTFRREVFQAKLLAVGIPPTGKKFFGSVRRLLIWVLGLAWQVCEGDRSNLPVNSSPAYNDVITMISWFSDVRYQFPPTTPAYRGRLTLIDFYHLLLRLF